MSENITFLFICNFSRFFKAMLAKVKTLSSDGISPPETIIRRPTSSEFKFAFFDILAQKIRLFWGSRTYEVADPGQEIGRRAGFLFPNDSHMCSRGGKKSGAHSAYCTPPKNNSDFFFCRIFPIFV